MGVPNVQLREQLRRAAVKFGEPITPDELYDVDIDVELLISTYGSTADASLAAGVSYINPDLNERAIIGNENDRYRRVEELERVHKRGYTFSPHLKEVFGSRAALLREAGIDPTERGETINLVDARNKTAAIISDLHFLPSLMLVVRQSPWTTEDLEKLIVTWPLWLEATVAMTSDDRIIPEIFKRRVNGDTSEEIAQLLTNDLSTNCTFPDPIAEIVHSIEELTDKLEHRPNKQEIRYYLPYWDGKIEVQFGSIEQALNHANVPDSRDLTPTGPITIQPTPKDEGEAPSHTDLLRDLHVVYSRGSNDIKTDFDNRAVIPKDHYRTQFGSFEEAIDHYHSFDYRAHRRFGYDPVLEHPELLKESLSELSQILERPPLIEEFVALSDYDLNDILSLFEDWNTTFSVPTSWGWWPTCELKSDLERVGAELGEPPTPEDIRNLGRYPVETYIRRFGSWPRALSGVGVTIDPLIPDSHLAISETRALWEITDILVTNEFGGTPALIDDLNRVAIDLRVPPTKEQYQMYGRYDLQTLQGKRKWDDILDDAGLEPNQCESGVKLDRTVIEKELQKIDESIDSRLQPVHVACSTNCSIESILKEYGTLAAAYEEANISSVHLARSVTSIQDAWHEDHWMANDYLDEIARLDEELGEPPRLRDLQEQSELYAQNIYRFYDTWETALIAASVLENATPPDSHPASYRYDLENAVQSDFDIDSTEVRGSLRGLMEDLEESMGP